MVREGSRLNTCFKEYGKARHNEHLMCDDHDRKVASGIWSRNASED